MNLPWRKRPPVEEAIVAGVWDDLDTFADFKPEFIRLVNSPEWKADIAPWFKRMLLETVRRDIHQPDGTEAEREIGRRLRVRAQLLEGILTEPYLHIVRMEAQAENERHTGDEE